MAETERVIRREDNVRDAIRGGTEPQAAYLKYRKILGLIKVF